MNGEGLDSDSSLILDRLPGLVPGLPQNSVTYQCWSVSLYCLYRRWPETHHEAETLGPFWGSSGEVWVVSGRGSWLHRFLTAHVGADPREEGHCCWVSPAPLAQLLSPVQHCSRDHRLALYPSPPSIAPFLFQGEALPSRVSRVFCVFCLIQHVHLGLLTWPCGDPPTAIGHPRWIWPWLGSAKD